MVIRILDEFKVNLAYRTISAPIAGFGHRLFDTIRLRLALNSRELFEQHFRETLLHTHDLESKENANIHIL